MRSGALPPGSALPPVRQLAVELGVNPNTVAAAYARLRAAGRVLTAGRKGTRVAGAPPSPTPVYAAPEGLRDLAGGQVDAALLPRLRGQAWTQALAQPLDGVAGDAPLLAQAAH